MAQIVTETMQPIEWVVMDEQTQWRFTSLEAAQEAMNTLPVANTGRRALLECFANDDVEILDMIDVYES